MEKAISILGTRGIPARYGGFETFAEHLALYLVSKGWKVTVYCQENGGEKVYAKTWHGIRLVHIPIQRHNALGSIIFDWESTWLASQDNCPILTLGYNTAIFCLLYRLKGIPNIINMDGLEWKRKKWNVIQKTWLYLNEWLGCWLGNKLIADHPKIKAHLATRVFSEKISVIPYGADLVDQPDASICQQYNLQANEYAIVIARAEPDNSILEIVASFSRKQHGIKLVILGRYLFDKNPYHQKVKSVASKEVVFLGSIYEKEVVQALRYYSRLYIHGHTVGGTNPSLVEALAAGSPVLAHHNQFNRWVAGSEAHYFKNEDECAKELELLFDDEKELSKMRLASRKRHQETFLWESVISKYESEIIRSNAENSGFRNAMWGLGKTWR